MRSIRQWANLVPKDFRFSNVVGCRLLSTNADDKSKSLVKLSHFFDDIPDDNRNKKTFQTALGLFLEKNVNRRGQVEFIYAALKNMATFGVHRDLDTYKRLLDVFPKGKMIPKNRIQTEFFHYPKHQQCCIDVLDQMELNGVYPDKELYVMVRNVFGEWTHAMRKMKRMIYWMPKLKHVNPYPIRLPLPNSSLEVAKLVIRRICRDPVNQISVVMSDSDWIVSGQSPLQQQHIDKHNIVESLHVDGPHRVWLDTQQISTFALKADANPKKFHREFIEERIPTANDWRNWETKFSAERPQGRQELSLTPSLHEQPDGTILALCATSTSTKDSLVRWTQWLCESNPKLSQIPIVYRLSHRSNDLQPISEEEKSSSDPRIAQSN